MLCLSGGLIIVYHHIYHQHWEIHIFPFLNYIFCHFVSPNLMCSSLYCIYNIKSIKTLKTILLDLQSSENLWKFFKWLWQEDRLQTLLSVSPTLGAKFWAQNGHAWLWVEEAKPWVWGPWVIFTILCVCGLCVICTVLSSRLLVGSPWSGTPNNRKGDVYKCEIAGPGSNCEKLNLQSKTAFLPFQTFSRVTPERICMLLSCCVKFLWHSPPVKEALTFIIWLDSLCLWVISKLWSGVWCILPSSQRYIQNNP